jgi:hypothetical protein
MRPELVAHLEIRRQWFEGVLLYFFEWKKTKWNRDILYHGIFIDMTRRIFK